MGRPPIGKTAMTGAERVARWRKKHAVTKPVTKPSTRNDGPLRARIQELEAALAAAHKPGERLLELEAELGRERIEHGATHSQYLRALDAIDGVWTRKQYNTILFCLHPDQRNNQSAERRDAAFHIVNRNEPFLLKKAERVTPPQPKPPTRAQMEAMKWQAKAKRRAKRAKPRHLGR